MGKNVEQLIREFSKKYRDGDNPSSGLYLVIDENGYVATTLSQYKNGKKGKDIYVFAEEVIPKSTYFYGEYLDFYDKIKEILKTDTPIRVGVPADFYQGFLDALVLGETEALGITEDDTKMEKRLKERYNENIKELKKYNCIIDDMD